jgi:maleylacetoacetate isomerase/maleylpyruvate isomerase
MLRLYTYWRSSAAWRVRIALNLKGLQYESTPVHLLRGGGEQFGAQYRELNPQSRVPTLVDGEQILTQSLAIIEYLDEQVPLPALLPAGAAARARVRSLAQLVACEIQPLQNVATTQYLRRELHCTDEQIAAWYREWIGRGLAALEARLKRDAATGRFCHGDAPTMADCCLVPQWYAAKLRGIDVGGYPTIARIESACRELDAFRRAAPEQQPDRE